ncbi:hypothetical protein [Desulfotalea psychrophila]|uniref:Uncharacterized protein n=1 Tax=Desulfotalea psychrophila (strain LSv54 / DSM 12343) TaxID=177439 RepID=Q6AMW6_DESPS|nr:hypothetical protein [Desulfotalea psychrophila]CAG36308.1 unknown protein [Desulfotalea psychrophila LSv54]
MNKENVKFYLQTVTATVLAIMAILVSFSQCSISKEQTKLLNVQTKIAKKQISPVFTISAKQLKDDIPGIYSEDKIFIENNGFIISDFHYNSLVLIDIELSKTPNVQKKKTYSLIGYYRAGYMTAKGSGLLATIFGKNNNLQLSQLDEQYSGICQKNDESCFINLRRYLKVRYKNAFDEQITEYYIVPLIYGGKKLSLDEGERLFRRYDDNVDRDTCLEFNKLTSEIIYHTISGT